MARAGTTAIGLALALGAAACANHLRRGTTLYDDGRYIEAAEVFEQTEFLVDTAPPRDRAAYATYRGLALLGLGDLRNAQRWLAYAIEVEQTTPGVLKAEQRAALEAGWQTLEERLHASPPPPMTPATALAASQLPPPLASPAPEPSSPSNPR